MNTLNFLKFALAGAASWGIAFVTPIAPFLAFTILLVFCDLYTGVRKAVFLKEEIHSKGLRRTITKVSLYMIAILLSEGLKQVFTIPMDITYAISGIIAITEFKSNLENISVYTGVDIWANLVKQLPSVGNLLKKNEDAPSDEIVKK
jgi:hypothetical protein